MIFYFDVAKHFNNSYDFLFWSGQTFCFQSDLSGDFPQAYCAFLIICIICFCLVYCQIVRVLLSYVFSILIFVLFQFLLILYFGDSRMWPCLPLVQWSMCWRIVSLGLLCYIVSTDNLADDLTNVLFSTGFPSAYKSPVWRRVCSYFFSKTSPSEEL